MSEFRLKHLFDGGKGAVVAKPSIPVGAPMARIVSALHASDPRDILAEGLAPIPLLQPGQNFFMADTLADEYGDVLCEGEKALLDLHRRHGQPVHEAEASNAIDAYHATGDVAQIDRAIALLLHLRQTKHPD